MSTMKRTMAAYLTAAALAVGLAAANFTPAACQTMETDELVKVPVSAYPVELEVWVNKGEDAVYRDGEEVGIRFRASEDCYVVIYDIDTEGFLSLLFPDDLYDDGFVEGGRIYKLPDPRARYELLAEGPPGIEYIAGIASATPIAVRLPWYLSDGYEAHGYRGHDELEATVSDVGAIRGDPYVAMRDIAYDILPDNMHEEDYDTDNTYFHVGRQERRHPRYLCYDCHGHVTWLDPYYDSCTVFDVRVDIDWVFIHHPTYYPVGPRWWYWRRHDCPTIYMDYPSFWCSLYPRHLYWDYYYDGIYRVGHRHGRRGNVYVQPRYRGKPGFYDRGNYGKRYRDPYSKTDGRRGGAIKDVDRRISGKDGRKYAGRGKGDLPRDVRQPERLGKLDDVRIKSRPDAGGRGRDKPEGRDYKSRGKSTERDSKARVKTSKRKTGSDRKSKLRIVKKSDKDKKSRSKSKAKVSKSKKSKKKSDGKKSSARSGKSKSKKKSDGKKSSARSGKSKSKKKSDGKKSSVRSGKSKSKKKSDGKKSSARSGKSKSKSKSVAKKSSVRSGKSKSKSSAKKSSARSGKSKSKSSRSKKR